MARQVFQSTKKNVPNSLVVGGSLTVLGGINNPDFARTITRLATTQEDVRQVTAEIDSISSETFGPAIRSSAPAIVIKADGTVVPEQITFQGLVKPLYGNLYFYLGIFKIYKDGDLYYTTPTAVTSFTWTVDIVQSLTPGPEVYPSINLYPSFSNRLITIELYDETGVDLKDTLNISILPSWESYIQNELSGYTPKYIGKFNAAHPSSYHNGDWWLVYDTDDTPITRGVYRAINYTPTLVDGSNAANSQFIVAALPDILWSSNNSYGELSNYAPITYISNLVSNAAFIAELFSNNITATNKITGAKLATSDGYCLMSNEADDEDGYKGITINSQPIDEGSPFGTALQMSNLYNLFGSRMPGLIWKSFVSGVWLIRSYIVHSITDLIIKNEYKGARIIVGGTSGQFYFTKEATSYDTGTKAVVNAYQFNGKHYGGIKCRAYIGSSSTTVGSIYTELAKVCDVTNEPMMASGFASFGTSTVQPGMVERINSTTIRIYGLLIGHGYGYKDVTSGSSTEANCAICV